MKRTLWKGNEAIAEAAIRAGCVAYFGYPITPQTELLEYMARRLPALGRVFLQAESEIAAINMLYGAAASGVRAMTSSSGPGISLMQEGLSYIAGAEVPCVVVDVMRGGPGLGNILASQSDYFQMTRSLGHGDFHPLTLAPASVQEATELTMLAFELAFRYRTVAVVLADGILGQMMEPVIMPPAQDPPPLPADWAVTGADGRPPRLVSSLHLEPGALAASNERLQAKLQQMRAAETRAEEYALADAEIIVVAFGIVARVAQSAIRQARAAGLRAGLFRPISLWPFPQERLRALAAQAAALLVVEMNAGQMLDDVRLAAEGRCPVHFMGRIGGEVPMPEEIVATLHGLDGRR